MEIIQELPWSSKSACSKIWVLILTRSASTQLNFVIRSQYFEWHWSEEVDAAHKGKEDDMC